MFAEERYREIVELVNRLGKATVTQLSGQLNVSPVTVRRDLEKLEERRLLVRTHGGAIPLDGGLLEVAHEKSFSEKEEAFAEEKQRIAEAAAALVEPEDAICLTPGTTNMLLARKLTAVAGLTIVTNAANIAVSIANEPNVSVLLTGGQLRQKSFALVGPLAEQSVNEVRVDKLFLGVDGFDLQEGLTTPNVAEASINRHMIGIAKKVIVVADHSKFGRVTFARIAPLDAVHTVISDKKLPKAAADELRERGIEVILA